MLDLPFRISVWAGETSVGEVALAFSGDPPVADGYPGRFRVGEVEWLVRLTEGRLDSECEGIFDGEPTISLNVVGPVDLGGQEREHRACAASIALTAVKASALPAVTGLECYSFDAHQIVAWMADGSWFVPRYEYTGGPPLNRYIDELREIYRPAMIRELDAAGISYAEPVFDHRWAIDETHRFIEKS